MRTASPGHTPTVEWAGTESDDYTPVADPAAAYRWRLMKLRCGTPAQVEAGRLLRTHGDEARRVLWEAPERGVVFLRVDELLAQAGVPDGRQVVMPW